MNNTNSSDQVFIQKLTEIIQANLSNENFGVNELAQEIDMSHSNLHRKLKSTSNQTISQFIREIRLKKAKELLLNEDLTVSEISYRVGFGSPTYFNNCFHDYFGYAPGESKSHNLISKSIEQPENASLKKTRHKPILIGLIIGLIIIISLTILLIQKGSFLKAANAKEKSIAILPFKYLSGEQEKQYLADGMMDAILLHLFKIKDLRVISRTSVEQYRKTNKTARIIGQELDVAYLLEGSLLKDGDQVRLIVQLMKTSDESHVWSNEYDRDWKEIFSVQSEVAETIASELHAAITPEEKQLIQKFPTTDLTAYDFYQRGRAEHTNYWIDNGKRSGLIRAEGLYYKALEYDSLFARAYAGLGRAYMDKHYWESYFSENFLDSALILANIALTYDDQLAEAYTLKGDCYREIGNTEQAMPEYDKAIKLNPNDWMAYWGKGILNYNDDLVKVIDNLQNAASLNHGPELPILLRQISNVYRMAGFIEKSNYYSQEALKLDDDSLAYYCVVSRNELQSNNNIKAIEFLIKGYKIDSTNVDILAQLGQGYMYIGQYKESLKYFKKLYEKSETFGKYYLYNTQRLAYLYWKNGYKKEAEFYFDKQIEYCNSLIKSGRPHAHLHYTYYDLAGVYAFRGEKDKAYENLRSFNQRQRIPLWMVNLIKEDPLFDNMRNEPEFQLIVRDMEAKYQAEHERVRKWLEEQKML
ncbi:MAG TPA: hypothetical protein DCR40_03720 [Prolixibacteraceae bacterium]|nr:hypothetical protein [Prolixibacteraceae bacterium]